MTALHRKQYAKSERGQILLMLAVLLPILLIFAGIAIDFGFAYITKASLSKAADSAALEGMRNLAQGQTQATTFARNAFDANYGTVPKLGSTPPVVNIAITTDGANNTVVNVAATATIPTFLLHFLSGQDTLKITSSAQATRPKLIMSLVLDRSGSMNLNGGAQALPPAVNNFISYFDDAQDQVAMVSFSSTARVDVSIRTGFQSTITSAVNSLAFGGATYAQAGLQDGRTQIDSVVTSPGENVVRVAVFFTDGWANTVNDTLSCPASTNLNFGGCAPPENAVGWCGNFVFMDPTTGQSAGCGATQFPSQATGGMQPLTMANISDDAMYRSIQVANAMRTENTVVYAIGLGNKISESYLQQIANDPASSTYDSNQPVGEAVFAPSPSQLQAVFQTIAAKILLRLSQ